MRLRRDAENEAIRAGERAPSPEAGAFARSWPAIVAAAFGVGWFYALGYGPTLDPRNVDWMFTGDWAVYALGFLFSRNADWGFPVGVIPDWPYPEGTSTGFTDANPLLSALFKLVSPWLPEDFQFAGIWFLLAFVLQGIFGAKIAALHTDDPVRRALGGIFFVVTPLLPFRAIHVALSGIFFVTAALYLALRRLERASERRPAIALAFVLLASAAGTHGYLSAMTLVLVTAFFVQLRLDGWISRGGAAGLVVGGVLVTLAVYVTFGLVGWRDMELGAEGFGDFSADLLALVNPMWGTSRFLPELARNHRQYEGYAYLGLGVIALLTIAVVGRRARPVFAPRRRALALALVAMSVYALSDRVTIAGQELFDFGPLYAGLGELTSIFRSSGRFLWPLHLALVAFAVGFAGRIERRRLGRALLALALALQIADVAHPIGGMFAVGRLERLTHPAWGSLGREYAHLSLHPRQLKWVCPRFDEALVHALSYEAYRRRVTFDGGHVMRTPRGIEETCDGPLTEARFDDATVYVLGRALQTKSTPFTRLGARCGVIDGLRVCVSPKRPSAMLDAILGRDQRLRREGNSSGGGSNPPG